MKKGVKGMLVLAMVSLMAIVSCKKNDADDRECQTCSANQRSLELCEEDGKIYVDGKEEEDLEGVSLSRVISELKKQDGLENLSCN